MSVILVDALPGHVKMLLASLREGDAKECWAFGLPPKRAIWQSFRTSLIRRAAFVNGEIAAMWGICGAPLGARGDIWLMTAKAIESVPVTFVREARREIDDALDLFPRLRGVLSLDYSQAVKLVKRLGFTITPWPDNPSFAFFEKGRADGN